MGGEDPLEKEMATHSSILAWKIKREIQKGTFSARCHYETGTLFLYVFMQEYILNMLISE